MLIAGGGKLLTKPALVSIAAADQAKPAGGRYGRCQLAARNEAHRSRDHGMLQFEPLSQTGAQHRECPPEEECTEDTTVRRTADMPPTELSKVPTRSVLARERRSGIPGPRGPTCRYRLRPSRWQRGNRAAGRRDPMPHGRCRKAG